MILQTLSLRNYKQYGSLDLEFREGLVGIIGKNGAGKSTIFEAILYCLYGKDEINNKELIRSAFADTKLPVSLSLSFTIGPAQYQVKRELRGKKLDTVNAELYKNDAMVAKGSRPVSDEITRLLQLDRDAFKRSVFSGQRELTQLSDTRGQDRAKMVRKMLGLDNLDDIQTTVGVDIRTLRSQIAGQQQLLLSEDQLKALEAGNSEIGRELARQQAELQAANEAQKALEVQFKVKKELFDKQEQLRNRFNEMTRLQTQLLERQEGDRRRSEQLQEKTESLRQQQAKLDADATLFRDFLSDQQKLEVLQLERQRKINFDAQKSKIDALQQPLQQSQARLAALTTQLGALPETEAQLLQQQEQLSAARQARENKRQEYQQISNALSTLDERIRERREKIAQLQEIGKGGTCPTCFQPVLDAYDAVLQSLQSETARLEARERSELLQQQEKIRAEGLQLKTAEESAQSGLELIQNNRARLLELSKQQKTEQKNIESLQASVHSLEVVLREIGAVHFDSDEFNRLSAQVQQMRPKYQAYSEELGYLAREMPLTAAELQKVRDRQAETKAQLAQNERNIEDLQYDEQRYQHAKADFSSFDETRQAQHAVVQDLLKASMALQNSLLLNQEKIAQHERVRAQIAGKQLEIDILEKLAELLRQFKTEILERVSPGISREASALFSRITKGKYENILVDENFEFSIADGGVYYPIERFSGGEIDLANFCLRIAITRAIMELSGAGQAVEFLAFDEIFGSQDEERRHEMMLALNYLQEQFRQIYIVSHIETQKDYFPHILEVKNTESGSVVRWV